MNQAKVFITRPYEQSKSLATLLEQEGVPFTLAPALAIDVLDKALPLPKAGDLGIFVSSNAVRSYFSRYNWVPGAFACAVGSATAKELSKHVDGNLILAPDSGKAADSESLLEVIDLLGLKPGHAYVYRAQSGRNWLTEQLLARNWQVQICPVYSRKKLIWNHKDCLDLSNACPAILLLTSKESYSAINASLKSYNLPWPDKLYLITLHERIAGSLKQMYLNSDKILDIMVTKPDENFMLEAISVAYRNFS